MPDPIAADLYLEAFPDSIRERAQQLRMLVKRAVPEAIEGFRPGWRLIGYDLPVGRRTAYFAFVWAEPVHVHLGFEWGVLMDDPEETLGGGFLKRVRFMTFGPADEIPTQAAEAFVRQAARVASMSRSERFAAALDRDAAPPT